MRLYSSSGTDIAVIEGTFLNTSLDESAAEKISALPMVAQVSPMIYNMMDLTPDVNALAYGWRQDSYDFDSLQILSGRRFRGGQPEVMLGDLLAQAMKKNPGDTMDIQGTPFTVTGIYHAQSALEADAVILPLDQLQQLSSLQGKVSTIHVKLRPAAAGVQQQVYMRQAETAIEALLPGLKAVPAEERASNNQVVRLAQASAWGTSSLALLIGILGIANTMVMSVFERTKEIGILRALGWKSWQVLALIQMEAAALGLGGGLVGVLVGWGALRVLATLPQTASVVTSTIGWPLLAEAMGIALLAGLLAGALPAWRASKLAPVDALHHD
jgi:putative ABC transport system permease protein